jgi:hypothetical protein
MTVNFKANDDAQMWDRIQDGRNTGLQYTTSEMLTFINSNAVSAASIQIELS